MDFYEENAIHLTNNERKKYAENPDLMSGYPKDRDKTQLLRNSIYRGGRKQKDMRKEELKKEYYFILVAFISCSVFGQAGIWVMFRYHFVKFS